MKQVCPTLDNSFWRRAETRLNILTGITLGGFLFWIGKVILVAFLSAHIAAAIGGR